MHRTLKKLPIHRCFSRNLSCRFQGSTLYFNPTTHISASTTPENLTPEQRKVVDVALRVDQAGELAANWIYKGQLRFLGNDAIAGPLIQEMLNQERKHLEVMNQLQLQHRVRPTLLSESARIIGFSLGAATALAGKETAMACTEAVETVIGEHYEDQLRDLEKVTADHPSIALLRAVVEEFKIDELEHLDIAVDNHSQRAPAHALFSSIIGTGCRIAIKLCKSI
ncbi:hypothetical protein AMATHDRAFT_68522 [Amanita thiersii Skay4041]|uniref:5-demethoxyubiquinone hydroxylase, mitochondrial n=1 Tax=Amanita thiersii Skay4041 TaxID=703135 RepID=A0A2A9NAE6_9AGAR|nr:hypothetical protein AMATHDRAFT_68522 [Amanita thiersii Skay4041]